MAKTRKTNAEYSAETRATLLRVAREEFAREGYAEAGTERIVERAKLTRGALYHHYKGKRELFEAVFEQLAAELAASVDVRAGTARDPFAALAAGCEAWLDAALDAEVQRILLIDGPAVLGWQRWTEIDARHGTAGLREGVEAALAAGQLVKVDAHALTRLLAGALNDVALMLAQSAHPAAERRKVGRAFRAILDGLRREP